MNKKYIVRLTSAERAICEATVKQETGKSQKLSRVSTRSLSALESPTSRNRWTNRLPVPSSRQPTGLAATRASRGATLACGSSGRFMMAKRMSAATSRRPTWPPKTNLAEFSKTTSTSPR